MSYYDTPPVTAQEQNGEVWMMSRDDSTQWVQSDTYVDPDDWV